MTVALQDILSMFAIDDLDSYNIEDGRIYLDFVLDDDSRIRICPSPNIAAMIKQKLRDAYKYPIGGCELSNRSRR